MISENSGKNEVVEPANRHSSVIAKAPRPNRIGPRAENLILSWAPWLMGGRGRFRICLWVGTFVIVDKHKVFICRSQLPPYDDLNNIY